MTSMLLWVLLVAGVVGALAYLLLRQRAGVGVDSSSQDRYAAEEAISPAHAKLLIYLQQAFPGQVVLFRPALSQLLSVRHAADRQRARQRLDSHRVDFVVCSSEGKAEYAFDVRERSAEGDASVRRVNALKVRVLKTAGVRLLRIQRSVRDMPPADGFRQRLEDSLRMAPSGTLSRADVPVKVAPAPADVADAPGSDLASLTDLMGLPPTPVDERHGVNVHEGEWTATQQQAPVRG